MKHYSISVTYKCDWSCPYCSADTHSKRTPPAKQIKQAIDEVEPGSDVSITGGEPGFAKREILEYAFTELKKKNCRITINTNGAFFTRYPDLCELTDDFFYHCSEDLDPDVDMYRPDPRYDVDHMIVVTDDNISRLDAFINKYPEINFLIHSADPVVVNGSMGPSLSKSNAIWVYLKYKTRIHPDSLLRLLNTSSELCEEEGMIIR